MDILVSNVVISTSNPIDEASLEQWKLNQLVLGTGYFLVAREAFRVMRAQGLGGSVVFVASRKWPAVASQARVFRGSHVCAWDDRRGAGSPRHAAHSRRLR